MDAWMQREAAREKEREKGLGKKEERGDQKQKKAEEEERQTGKGKAGWSKLKSHVLPSPDRSQVRLKTDTSILKHVVLFISVGWGFIQE